jgi:hypothetical protein
MVPLVVSELLLRNLLMSSKFYSCNFAHLTSLSSDAARLSGLQRRTTISSG